MKKLLLFSILLNGCKCSTSSYFVVSGFKSTDPERCVYKLYQVGNETHDYTFIKDTCGKYNVGDTLIFTLK